MLPFVDVPASSGSDHVPGTQNARVLPTPDGAQVIRALALDSGNLLAPEAKSHITNFTRGVYWTLPYDGGNVRLRIMPLYGSARVSGVFFDSP